MTVLISAKNISYHQNKNTILDNISLDILAHDFITIVGPNGAGKSTLIKTLANIIQPSEGEVVRKPDLKIGYSPQSFIADPLMPISTEYFLNLNNHCGKEALEQAIDQTQICRSILTVPLGTLSGGEMQRVLLCRALIQKPDVLILDEPTQNLDIKGQLDFYKLIESLHQQKTCSIVMVSHDLHIVMASSKKVVCMQKHICCSGEGNLIVKEQAFIDLFGSELAEMIAIYPHQHNHNHDHDHHHH